jgi:hypothetical protein
MSIFWQDWRSSHMREIRFTTFIDDYIECEVFATVEDGRPIIQSVNVVDDCCVTYDDLSDEAKDFFVSEARRVMQEMAGVLISSLDDES